MENLLRRIKKSFLTYYSESGAQGVALGLSGGLDSAVVAKMCIDTIGKKNVHLFFMPDRALPVEEYEHIEILKDFFKIPVHPIGIDNLRIQFEELIPEFVHAQEASFERRRIAMNNISPRIRADILYLFSNLCNYLVIGTCNLSEIMVGYFTKYGDGASDYELIGGFHKTEVYKLARMFNIPEEIINKAPSAGLEEGQTDEGELGIGYELLDQILEYRARFASASYIAEKVGVSIEEVERIMWLIKKSEHKRRMPPIPGSQNDKHIWGRH